MAKTHQEVVKLLENKEVYIFDMDGTLVDLEELNYVSFRDAIAQVLSKSLTYAEYMAHFAGSGSKAGFQSYLASVGLETDIDSIIKIYRAMKRDSLQNRFKEVVKVKDGAVEYLKRLKESGKRLGLATSTVGEFAEYILTKVGIIDLFDVKIYIEDVTNSKPNPEMFLTALDRLGGKKEKAVIFEDSENGVKAARNSGMDYVVVVAKGHNDSVPLSDDYVITNYLNL